MPWLTAAALLVAHALAFWPGMVSFDSAVMWWQARGGAPVDNIHSPLLVYTWRLLRVFGDSPAPIYLLHLALFWSGLALLASALPRPAWIRAAVIALIGLAPPLWMLLMQVWTDVGLLAALVFASGCLARAGIGSRHWCWPAAAALIYAGGMRANAWPAVIPLLWPLAVLAMPTATRTARLGFGIATAIAMMLLITGINASVPRHVAVWPATAMWDLAAISIAEHRVLLPAGSVGHGMSVADLKQAFEPWAGSTLFARTRAGVRQPFLGPDQGALKRRIAQAWWQAVRHYPGAYLRHRWRLTRALFGTHPASWPRELIYTPAQTHLADNPPLARRTDPWHRYWMHAFERWRSTALLAAWPWLLLYLPALPLAWLQRENRRAVLAMALIASGLLYAAPLPWVAPAAPLRYLGWSCAAALLALALALCGVSRRHKGRMAHGEPHFDG